MTSKNIGCRAPSILVVGIAALTIAACGSSGNGNGGATRTSGTGTAANANPGTATNANAKNPKDYKVAVLSIGSDTDRSFAQANFDGALQAQKKYRVQVTIVPNIITPDQYLQQGTAFARRGFDMVLLDFGVATQAAVQLARDFPGVRFGVPWAPTPQETAALPPNVFTWDPQQQEGSFLTGALAALVNKSGVVGSVSGSPFPLITRQLEGFELGARCVKPGIQVLQRYTGDTTFADAGLARSATDVLTGKGADPIYVALDGASNGVYEGARAKPGTRVIAQYFDQSAKAPDVILTSVLFNFQGIDEDLIRRGFQGQITPRDHLVYTLANLNVGTLAGFGKLGGGVSSDARNKLNAIEQKIRSGQIKVPDNATLAKPGAAKNIDLKTLGC